MMEGTQFSRYIWMAGLAAFFALQAISKTILA
jgi:hypothetical protein